MEISLNQFYRGYILAGDFFKYVWFFKYRLRKNILKLEKKKKIVK